MGHIKPALRVLIADDEAPARRQLRRMFDHLPGFDLVGEAASGPEAVRLIETLRPDIVLLDVQMPGLNGLEVLAQLTPPIPQTIFVTAFDQYALSAFDLAATDYLLKPWGAERLWAALERARDRFGRGEVTPLPPRGPLRRLLLREGERWHVLATDLLISLTAQDNYVLLHTAARDWLLRETLSALLERLQHPEMIRVHRSHAVNLRQVLELETQAAGDGLLKLADGQSIPFSRTYRAQILLGLQGLQA